jgi:hypothetical protein
MINVPNPTTVAKIPVRPQHSLYGSCAFRTDQVSKSVEQSAFCRFLTEGEPGDRDHHDQHGASENTV